MISTIALILFSIDIALLPLAYYLGKLDARRTGLKPHLPYNNPIIQTLFVTFFILTFLVPGLAFYGPISIISEEAATAKYLGYEFITPISYDYLFNMLIITIFFNIVIWLWLILYIFGWAEYSNLNYHKESFVIMKIKPNEKTKIETEEVAIRKDKNGIERIIPIEIINSSNFCAWHLWYHGMEKACPRLIKRNWPRKTNIKIDGMPTVLLKSRTKKKSVTDPYEVWTAYKDQTLPIAIGGGK